jgi:hypothetical protein
VKNRLPSRGTPSDSCVYQGLEHLTSIAVHSSRIRMGSKYSPARCGDLAAPGNRISLCVDLLSSQAATGNIARRPLEFPLISAVNISDVLDAAPSGKGTRAKSLCIAERSGQVYFAVGAETTVRVPASSVYGGQNGATSKHSVFTPDSTQTREACLHCCFFAGDWPGCSVRRAQHIPCPAAAAPCGC